MAKTRPSLACNFISSLNIPIIARITAQTGATKKTNINMGSANLPNKRSNGVNKDRKGKKARIKATIPNVFLMKIHSNNHYKNIPKTVPFLSLTLVFG